MQLADALVTMLWRNAVAAIPLAILVIVFCRLVPCRPSTRHALWLLVLGSLVLPPVIPQSWREAALDSTKSGLSSASHSIGNAASKGSIYVAHLASAAYSQFRDRELPQCVDATPVAKESAPNDLPAKPAVLEAASVNLRSPSNEGQRVMRAAPQSSLTMAQFDESGPSTNVPHSSCAPAESSIERVQAFENGQVGSLSATKLRTSESTCASAPIPARIQAATAALPVKRQNPSGSDSYSVSSPSQSLTSPMTASAPTAQSPYPVVPRSKPVQSPITVPAATTDAKPRSMTPLVADSAKTQASPIAPAAPKSSFVDDAKKSVQPWIDSAASVRDAVVRIPPLPMTFWFGGMIVLLLLAAIRILRFRTILAHSTPADAQTVSMVNHSARQLQLGRVPVTVMTERSLPPMIWCGWPMKLVLPAALWDELDDVGRRAVVMHELAHLKRRDHWVCWLSAIIGLVYWWHPMVWWCRRRLREEADFCCDNWVTTLLPRARRAYAQALLTARTSMNETGSPMPAVGLGATTPRAKRFARRLTMVMTNQTGPRMSRWGFAGVALLGAVAWLAAPMWACPPEDCTEQSSGKVKAKARSPVAVTAPTPAPRVMVAPRMATPAPLRGVVIAPGQPTPPPGAEASTFERHMAERRAQPGVPVGGAGMDGRLEQLERRLDELAAQLHQLMKERQGGPQSKGPDGGADPFKVWAPQAHAHDHQPQIAQFYGDMAAVERAAALGALRRSADSGEIIDRVYKLPDGKLESFTELMARQDVPILIERQQGGILVHATASQHEIVAAFLAIIDPEGNHGPAGGGAMNSLQDQIRWKTAEEMARLGRQDGMFKRQAEQQALLAERMAGGAQRRALLDAARGRSEGFRKQAVEVRRQAEQMRKQSEKLRRKADDTRRKSSDAGDDEKRQAELESQAETVEREAEQIELAAEQLEENAENLEEQAELAMEEIEQVEEALAMAAEEAAEVDAEMAEMEAELEAEAAELADEESFATPEAPEPPIGMEIPSLPTLPPLENITPPSEPSPPTPPAPRSQPM